MLKLREYQDTDGQSPFANWFSDLDVTAAAKVTVAIARIEQGNHSNVKGVGEGVLEYRIDFGPGYRVYFGLDGDVLVILLADLGSGAPKSANNETLMRPRCVGPTTNSANDWRNETWL